MITTVLNSLPGRALRFVAGSAIATWGFDFGLPEALFVQTFGITIAIFAIANVSVLKAVGIGQHRAVAHEKHA